MPDAATTYRLLVVDDDAIDRKHYGKLLSQQELLRCDIVEASDGQSGLAALREHAPDLLLLDYRLPDMTALDFLQAATSSGDLPCAVVLITGHGNEMIAVEAMKQGVRDYLVKDQLNQRKLTGALLGAMTQRELQLRLVRSRRDLQASHERLEAEVATRQQAEAALLAAKNAAELANQAKSRFVAMISHELRTPLNCILGYAELLKLEGLLNTGQSLRVDAMMQAGQHLLSLIEKVLSFSSIDAGRLEVRPEPLAVRPFMEGCMDVVAPIAVERKLPLSTVIAPDTPSLIVADPARLKQILLNLLGNALKYTDHGGVELRVSAGAAPGGLRIDVADTGRGIDPAVRARLFQSFERLDSADQVEGAGLGLAIAARITEAMHGSIGHAENPGGGSIFWLELPPGDPALPTTVPADRQADATSAQNSWGPGPPGNPPSGKRLLIVDDIEMNRDLLQAYLRAAKLVPVLAASGEEAVDLASKEAFDLILMDVRMPGMDGLEATRRIRAMPAPLGRVPILGVTAHAFAEQVADCLAAGMDGHIAKPLAYDALMEAISDIVARAPGLDLALA